MFDLVADVPRYPEFLPWCTAARVRKQEGPNVEVDELTIGFGPLHEVRSSGGRPIPIFREGRCLEALAG